MVFLLFLHFLVVTNQDYWEPYFENDKLKISYKTSICNGKNVIVEAEYFVIRI